MQRLVDIMQALRDPQTGCPWDIRQTFKTIVPYTLEEAYEVADAIEQGDMQELKSELGDLLFQVVFYAQMADEQKLFNIDDVIEAVCDKLVSRHPHVFDNAGYRDEASLHTAWENAKAQERDQRAEAESASVLEGVALALPALKRAQKLQKRAARVGFDWPQVMPVLDKIEEEIQELREAINEQDVEACHEETGDLLFSCVNLSRHLKVDAEEALRACNKKFEKRFSYIEKNIHQSGRKLEDCELDELEALWCEAKCSVEK